MNGQLVDELTNEYKAPGEHRSVWNAEGNTSGIYLIRLDAGKSQAVKKVVLLK